ncbi:MAG: hypothetical protein E5V66_00860 [Mesorhizobium sp.]|uniref:hypothetical protein n=1 Tax=Mesorhizobium sp. TaxID=1871066 RepID=UPI0011F6C90F|nr:hypothetical protein [Mesorhizobium sp.]TIU68359.1 MAG: hypothetical protein E5W25_12980 [Mesorhizobium sp.]TIW14086.1 MAG: hypothetical protein E5V66_00860 [Mesorhizobium sp.]TIW68893.1 MAG: hypothetical protein E5V56_04040 [Mesorhizobium sp.]TIX73760.1 MAG: hypothetical protein E5V30_00155 [Mesorhizobium sp.]
MAYIEIFPKSAESQGILTGDCDVVMSVIHQATKDVLNIPDHDIIVELNHCTAIGFNALAVHTKAVPDVVIKISTSDHDLQPKFETLCARIVAKWDAHFEIKLKLEIWINLIDTWGCNIDFG